MAVFLSCGCTLKSLLFPFSHFCIVYIILFIDSLTLVIVGPLTRLLDEESLENLTLDVIVTKIPSLFCLKQYFINTYIFYVSENPLTVLKTSII